MTRRTAMPRGAERSCSNRPDPPATAKATQLTKTYRMIGGFNHPLSAFSLKRCIMHLLSIKACDPKERCHETVYVRNQGQCRCDSGILLRCSGHMRRYGTGYRTSFQAAASA